MVSRWLATLGHLDKIPELGRCYREFSNWGGVIRHFLALPGARYPAVARLRSGVEFSLEEFCDTLSVWEMYCRKQYEVPGDAKTIIDAGANIGVFAVWAAGRAPGSRVFCFEPFPATFARLVKNIERYQLGSRVTCTQAALAPVAGMREMSGEGVASSARTLAAEGSQVTQKNGGAVAVRAMTLAEVIAQVREATGGGKIDVLKVDIEGTEHEIFPELEPGVLREVRRVEIEYHPTGNCEPVFESLRRAGFECVRDAWAGENLGVAGFVRAEE